MRILHVTSETVRGGAGLAALRLHAALRQAGLDSRILVRRRAAPDPLVLEAGELRAENRGRTSGSGRFLQRMERLQRVRGALQRLPVRARGRLGAGLAGGLGMKGCSLNILPTGLHRALNESDADVVHLHWIHDEMISIREIAKIEKPLVWTLHDMWALCGAEHYPGWAASGGRPADDGGPAARGAALREAVNRWIARRKRRSWRRLPVHFVAPSRWMAGQVRASDLFGRAPVTVIPNALDPAVFRPLDRAACRLGLGLAPGGKLLVFGANAPAEPNKGLALLERALELLPGPVLEEIGLAVFGAEGTRRIAGRPTRWMGRVGPEQRMAELYNAADAVCVPSRTESFGMTALEALACGVPVVAFRTSGLAERAVHRETGWLAEPFDPADYARGIEWALGRPRPARPPSPCRDTFFEAVARRHEALYLGWLGARTAARAAGDGRGAG